MNLNVSLLLIISWLWTLSLVVNHHCFYHYWHHLLLQWWDRCWRLSGWHLSKDPKGGPTGSTTITTWTMGNLRHEDTLKSWATWNVCHVPRLHPVLPKFGSMWWFLFDEERHWTRHIVPAWWKRLHRRLGPCLKTRCRSFAAENRVSPIAAAYEQLPMNLSHSCSWNHCANGFMGSCSQFTLSYPSLKVNHYGRKWRWSMHFPIDHQDQARLAILLNIYIY